MAIAYLLFLTEYPLANLKRTLVWIPKTWRRQKCKPCILNSEKGTRTVDWGQRKRYKIKIRIPCRNFRFNCEPFAYELPIWGRKLRQNGDQNVKAKGKHATRWQSEWINNSNIKGQFTCIVGGRTYLSKVALRCYRGKYPKSLLDNEDCQ